MEKLLYEGGRIIGTAGPQYAGPKKWIPTPEDFDFDRAGDYEVVNGKLVPPNIFEILEEILDDYIEAKARERNYGSKYTSATQSLVGYKDDAEPRYAKEAEIFIAWRSAIFTKCYWLMDQVRGGHIPMPTGIADVMPHITILDWSEHVIPPLREPTMITLPTEPPPAPPEPVAPPAPPPEPPPVVEPEVEPDPEPVVDPVVEPDPEVEPEPDPVEPEPVVDPEPTEPDPVVPDPVEPEPEPVEPPVETEPEPEPVVPTDPDPDAPTEPVEPEPEPTPVEPEPEP